MAHELRERPIIAEAFRAGDLSYSVLRIVARLDRPDPDVDLAGPASAEGRNCPVASGRTRG